MDCWEPHIAPSTAPPSPIPPPVSPCCSCALLVDLHSLFCSSINCPIVVVPATPTQPPCLCHPQAMTQPTPTSPPDPQRDRDLRTCVVLCVCAMPSVGDGDRLCYLHACILLFFCVCDSHCWLQFFPSLMCGRFSQPPCPSNMALLPLPPPCGVPYLSSPFNVPLPQRQTILQTGQHFALGGLDLDVEKMVVNSVLEGHHT